MDTQRSSTGIFTAQIGEGPALLVLHGGPGLDHSYFRPWLDPLSDFVRVIYCDLPGNGRSAEPADWNRVDHESWVVELDALRRQLGHDQIIVLGHSYGGFIALEYALRYAPHVAGLILCDTAPAADYGAATLANAQARGTPDQVEVVSTAFTQVVTEDPLAFRRLYETILPLYFHREVPAAVWEATANMVYRPAAFNRVFLKCRPQFDVLARLSEIAATCLVLHGRHDWITPPEIGGVRLAAGLAHADLEVFENSGHFPFIEEQQAFVQVVSRWISRISLPEPAR